MIDEVAFYEIKIEVDAKAEGSIHILRVGAKTKEMVSWDIKEWEEDPTLVFNIADAIQMALLEPERADDLYRRLGKL